MGNEFPKAPTTIDAAKVFVTYFSKISQIIDVMKPDNKLVTGKIF